MIVFKKLGFASDHAGVTLKKKLIILAESLRIECIDYGTHSEESVDYPDYSQKVVDAIRKNEVEAGVLVCGSGTGMAIAANRYSFIRAAVCYDHLSAELARSHNDINIIALGERLMGLETAKDCFKVFLTTAFSGGKHQCRIEKLASIKNEVIHG
jgi:ribose 5-phosphate isomerase B